MNVALWLNTIPWYLKSWTISSFWLSAIFTVSSVYNTIQHFEYFSTKSVCSKTLHPLSRKYYSLSLTYNENNKSDKLFPCHTHYLDCSAFAKIQDLMLGLLYRLWMMFKIFPFLTSFDQFVPQSYSSGTVEFTGGQTNHVRFIMTLTWEKWYRSEEANVGYVSCHWNLPHISKAPGTFQLGFCYGSNFVQNQPLFGTWLC